MGRRKFTTTVYIEEWQEEALQELSRRTNVPMAHYVRCGVGLVLEKHRMTESAHDNGPEQHAGAAVRQPLCTDIDNAARTVTQPEGRP